MSIEVYFSGNKKVNATINGFTATTDQPVKDGGEGTAPSPFELFLASLGTCAGIYVKGFCDSRGIDASGIRLSMDAVFSPEQKRIGKFIIRIHVPAGFPVEYEPAVIKTASLCTVKRHLDPAIQNEIIVVRP